MAYKLTARLSATASGATNVEVPEEVANDIEEMYKYLREHGDQEGFAEFDSAEDRQTFTKQARAYCATRQAGVLTFRQLPSKNLADNLMRFTIKANIPANAAAGGSASSRS